MPVSWRSPKVWSQVLVGCGTRTSSCLAKRKHQQFETACKPARTSWVEAPNQNVDALDIWIEFNWLIIYTYFFVYAYIYTIKKKLAICSRFYPFRVASWTRGSLLGWHLGWPQPMERQVPPTPWMVMLPWGSTLQIWKIEWPYSLYIQASKDDLYTFEIVLRWKDILTFGMNVWWKFKVYRFFLAWTVLWSVQRRE